MVDEDWGRIIGTTILIKTDNHILFAFSEIILSFLFRMNWWHLSKVTAEISHDLLAGCWISGYVSSAGSAKCSRGNIAIRGLSPRCPANNRADGCFVCKLLNASDILPSCDVNCHFERINIGLTLIFLVGKYPFLCGDVDPMNWGRLDYCNEILDFIDICGKMSQIIFRSI